MIDQKIFTQKQAKGLHEAQGIFFPLGNAQEDIPPVSRGISPWWCPFSTRNKIDLWNWWLAQERFCYEWTLSVARDRRLTKGKWTSLLSIIALKYYLDGSAELNTKKLFLSSFSLYGQNFLGRVKRILSFLVHQQNKYMSVGRLLLTLEWDTCNWTGRSQVEFVTLPVRKIILGIMNWSEKILKRRFMVINTKLKVELLSWLISFYI